MTAGAGWGRSPREVGIELLLARRGGDGERLARFAIRAESPLFTGHFPARPLLPGVAQLALVTWALAASSADGGDPGEASDAPRHEALRPRSIPPSTSRPLSRVEATEAICHEIDSLRLRAAVYPGDTLEVRLTGPEAGGLLRFDVSRQGAMVTRGSGRWLPAPPAPAPVTDVTPAGADELQPPHAGAREIHLPHGAPARLVRQVLAVAPGQIVCACEISADHPLASAGLAPGYLALEAAAQTAGALALTTGQSERPQIGYLVGVRNARVTASLPAGAPFRATAWLEGSAPPLAIYRFVVEAGGGESATGTLSTYLGKDDEDS